MFLNLPKEYYFELGGRLLALVKTMLLFILRLILILFGVLVTAGVIYNQFEGDFSLSELSLLEIGFWFAFVSICIRHYYRCKGADLNLLSIVYLPLRNIGVILFVSIVFIVLGFVFDKNFTKEIPALGNRLYSDYNSYQLLFISVYLLCIYVASPAKKIEPIVTPSDDLKTEMQ